MIRLDPKKELLAAALSFGFGLGVLPALIYLVGTVVVGTYEGDGGLAALYSELFRALGDTQAAAWLLVLSPYLVVQLLRAACALRAGRPAVKNVTD